MFSRLLRQFNTYFLYDKNSLKPFFEFKIRFKSSEYFEIWSISKSFKVLQDKNINFEYQSQSLEVKNRLQNFWSRSRNFEFRSFSTWNIRNAEA